MFRWKSQYRESRKRARKAARFCQCFTQMLGKMAKMVHSRGPMQHVRAVAVERVDVPVAHENMKVEKRGINNVICTDPPPSAPIPPPPPVPPSI